jgi:electron transfer flavoprotein alpha subunit
MLEQHAPDSNRAYTIEPLDLSGIPEPRVRVESVAQDVQAGLALDDARLVVCVGMGIGSPDALERVYLLARELGEWMHLSPGEVAVGGTRKVIEAGWLPSQQQVGITGRAVAPDLYLAIGVQGNFNHTSGILRSGVVVSVNNDPDAPIFEASDIGIVSGWEPLVESLISRLAGRDIGE